MYIVVISYSNVIKSLYLKNESLADTYSSSIANKDRQTFYNFALDVRKDYPKDQIILLSSNGGPGSFLPRPGIIGEPQKTYGKDWGSINSSNNTKYIKSTLKKYNINYFLIDLSKELWGNIVISSIFEKENLLKYFKIIKNNNDYFLLTWKTKKDIDIRSNKFLNLIELKRSNIINAILSNNFKNNYLNNNIKVDYFYKKLNIQKQSCLKNTDNKNLINLLIKEFKKTNAHINTIDNKIKNIKQITKEVILKKYGGLYWMDNDLLQISSYKKIYLSKVKNEDCIFVF